MIGAGGSRESSPEGWRENGRLSDGSGVGISSGRRGGVGNGAGGCLEPLPEGWKENGGLKEGGSGVGISSGRSGGVGYGEAGWQATAGSFERRPVGGVWVDKNVGIRSGETRELSRLTNEAANDGNEVSMVFMHEVVDMNCPVSGLEVPMMGMEDGVRDYRSEMQVEVELGRDDSGAVVSDLREECLEGWRPEEGLKDMGSWEGSGFGKFSMGQNQGEAMKNSKCPQGVRVLVQPKNSDKGILEGPPMGGPVFVNKQKSVWGRPLMVPLPVVQEQGADAECGGRVKLVKEEVFSTVKRFDKALVGRSFGRKFSFELLNAELHRRWNEFGNFRLVTMSGECFVCFFENIEGRDAVLMGGPWIVAGQVIGVDSWSPAFSPVSRAGFVTPVWIRMPGLPMYCWGGGESIARIAGCLGKPAGMDSATDRLERGHYARVCVRLDLSKPLRPGVWIDGPYGSFFQKVEYEGLSSFCFHCGHVGHKAEGCNSKMVMRGSAVNMDGNGKVQAVGGIGTVGMDCKESDKKLIADRGGNVAKTFRLVKWRLRHCVK